MKTIKVKIICGVLAAIMILSLVLSMSLPVFADDATATDAVLSAEVAEEVTAEDATGTKAIAAAIVVGIASAVGALAMGLAIAKSVEGMARQPEAAGKINSAMMLGLVFVETLIIYALIVAILIIFVL